MSNLPLHLSPRPVRATSARLRASQAADDLRRNGVLLGGCAAILALALLIGVLTEGWVMTWHGFIPVEPLETVETVPCGDYCGTDAGLVP